MYTLYRVTSRHENYSIGKVRYCPICISGEYFTEIWNVSDYLVLLVPEATLWLMLKRLLVATYFVERLSYFVSACLLFALLKSFFHDIELVRLES